MSNDTVIKTTWRHASPEITETFTQGPAKKPYVDMVPLRPNLPVTLNGVIYETVGIASKTTTITEARIRSEMSRKNSRDIKLAVVPTVQGRTKLKFVIDGVEYHGYDAARRGTGLSTATIKLRVAKAKSKTFNTKDFKKAKEPIEVTIGDIVFPSMLEASRRTGKAIHVVRKLAGVD